MQQNLTSWFYFGPLLVWSPNYGPPPHLARPPEQYQRRILFLFFHICVFVFVNKVWLLQKNVPQL